MQAEQPQPYRFSVRHFIQLAKPYWVSEDKKKGWALLLTVLAMNLAIVWVNVRLNYWNNDFYNSLQARKFEVFKHLLFVFTGYAFLYIVLAVYSQYFLQMLQIRWRRWVTEVFLKDWLVGGAHYRMSLRQGNADNPDQRIADDIRLFVNDSLSLFFGFISSVVTLLSFLMILWTLSGAISLLGVSIPGYMVWVALAYAGFGSYFAHKVGKPLIKLNFNQQRYEADFRFGLARTREHNEGIALYRGEAREIEGHTNRFAYVWNNWWGIMKRQKLFTWYSSFYGQMAIIFPILVAAPRYFAGQIQLGGLTQTASAFGQVQGALSWFIDAYGRIVDWRATQERLYTFVQSVEAVRHVPVTELLDGTEPADAAPDAAVAADPGGIDLGDLRIATPDGRALLQAAGERIAPGQHTLFVGPSGLGKSTLVRWLAGIWPYAQGTHYRLASGRSLFLPQKPYLPMGTLRQALTYPLPPEQFDDARLREVLELARIPALAAVLDQTDTWMQRLSPGEQQRLAIARALLAAPDWLFLDEATSALDGPTEAAMYALLQQQLPGTTLVSVAHRAGVVRFHKQILVVQPGDDGAPARLVQHTAQQAEARAAAESGDWALAGV
ncbi:ABC transporter ATP-binding protein/permease [Thiomonas sp.]|jgi:putative ATP-binding cassette transporter|uniref:ABC transporter ATP-binding protein/permease n=1 Tax=Thiomonas sp. TaxID=2047785 RepID=UPI00258BF5EF|nr:ABC transporter ATP-binding protein/permease [Thiomonas sp.]